MGRCAISGAQKWYIDWKSLLNLTTWKCICLLVSKSLELLKNKLKRQKVSLHSYEDKQRAKHDTWCSPYSNVAPVLSEQINNSLLHFGTKTSNRNLKQWSIHSPRVMEQTPASNSKWSVGWFHDSRDELKTKQHKVSRTYREIFQYIYIIYIMILFVWPVTMASPPTNPESQTMATSLRGISKLPPQFDSSNMLRWPFHMEQVLRQT